MTHGCISNSDQPTSQSGVLGGRRLSTALLICVPILDIVLVSASLVDVARGSAPGLTHGLAALYLGFTVAFGHSVIRWADGRFAHRFAGGPPPPRAPQHGMPKVLHEWKEWGKLLLGWAIALAVMTVTALVSGSGIPNLTTWATPTRCGVGARGSCRSC